MARKTAKAFYQNEIHGLFRRARSSNQLVIPESLRERLIETFGNCDVGIECW